MGVAVSPRVHHWRLRLGFARAVLGLGTALAAPAHAGVCFVASEPSAVERGLVIDTELAEGGALWLAAETRARVRLAWLIEDPDTRAIEPRGAELVAALDAETTPTVRRPLGISPTECGRVAAEPRAGRTTVDPTHVRRVEDAASLAELGVSADACDVTLPVLVVAFELPDAPAVTRAVRLSSAGARPFRSAFRTPVTFFTIGEGRAAWPSVPELRARDLELTYALATQSDDYPRVRDAVLDAATGSISLREAVLPLVFPDETTNAARLPLFAKYYRIAQPGEASSCLAQLDALLSGSGLEPVTGACPLPRAPLLGFPPLPACEEPGVDGLIAPSRLRCGEADDWALALTALSPRRTWLTRSTARLAPGQARTLAFRDAVREGPALEPARIDTSGCRPSVPSGGVEPAPPVTGYTEGPRVTEPEPELVPVVYVERTSSADSCSGEPAPAEDDSCSGDSSDSSQGDSCSGDSSASSEDDSCSGDSSGSSDSSEDESCTGDSSSSRDSNASSDDASCSGDSSDSDDDYEACAGSGATAQGQSVRRPRRARLSVWTLALTAVYLPARRVGRKKNDPDRR